MPLPVFSKVKAAGVAGVALAVVEFVAHRYGVKPDATAADFLTLLATGFVPAIVAFLKAEKSIVAVQAPDVPPAAPKA